jgi:hypothetical protein
MPTDSYPARTEQNVIDSDGTLIIARVNLPVEPIIPGKLYPENDSKAQKTITGHRIKPYRPF